MSKWMWIIAGPNGAGKSSFVGDFLVDIGHRNLLKLNADERTIELRKKFPAALQDTLNLKAAIEIDKTVECCIKSRVSFVVETVLSSQKYRDDVLAAKEAGFKIGMIYISLYPPELSPQRVSERVAKGGHNVRAEKAIERYRKSHEQLSWFAPQADVFMAFDNSLKDGSPVLLASRVNNEPLKYLARGVNPYVDSALSNMMPIKCPR
ncbi:Zeta toxin [Candidatus Magnetobacterium bavaricum]|uniref:Zeta toxin n=1 Tax=Candidatus Magnetobacterium bavaricum TaxID=29290 RepID=A0A0F3GYE0_9BACT|nr:Zeta toxin [Candidatus Magnetobacterium bavaricum]